MRKKMKGELVSKWGIFFSQLGKKILQSCKSCRGPHTHTHAYTCVRQMEFTFRRILHLNLYSPRPSFCN